jgi:hypothetical protein
MDLMGSYRLDSAKSRPFENDPITAISAKAALRPHPGH